MTCVYMTEKMQICGALVELVTLVSQPYGDASLTFYLVLPDNKRITLHYKGDRSVVKLGKESLHNISQEDKEILISSVQHNLDLEGERAHVFKTIRQLYTLFAHEPDSVPF